MPTKRLRSIGPALGLVVDKVLLRKVGWTVATEIELEVDAERQVIVLSKAQARRALHAAPAPLRATRRRGGGLTMSVDPTRTNGDANGRHPMPLSVKLREAELHCPGCGAVSFVDERTPCDVIDWELSRFRCPHCWQVVCFALTVTQVKAGNVSSRRSKVLR
jgi:hypothetical protein